MMKSGYSIDIQQAFKAHQQGNYQLAEAGYTQFLQNNPNHADTLNLLGCLKKQQYQFDQAIHFIQKAIDIAPHVALYHYNLGLAYLEISKTRQAIDAWKKTIALDPGYMDAYANIGYAFVQLNELNNAQQILLKGFARSPQNQLILFNLATAFHKNELFEKASLYYKKLLAINEKHVLAFKGYGHLLYRTGNLVDAINCLLNVIHLQPDCIDTWYLLGCAYQDNCQDDDAVKCFNQVLSLDPNALKAYYNLGRIEVARGRLTSGKQYYQAALDQNPNYMEILVVQGVLHLDMADMDNAQYYIQKAFQYSKNQHSTIGSIFLYSLNFLPKIPRVQVYEHHRKWGNHMINNCNYSFSHNQKNQSDDHTIRIGYVSPDFRVHSVAYFILPILKNHDFKQFKIIIYSNVGRPDRMTDEIRQHCHVFRNIRGMGTMAASKLIYDDQPDILVDLAGHTHHNRLDIFAMKPAPVQITYLGYPGTTGLTTIDYRISDRIADPMNDNKQYTEELIRIEPPFICYDPPDNSPDPSDLPMIGNGFITFGSFNHLGKINHCVVQLWIKLLHLIPDARLILKSRPFHDIQVCKRFQDMFRSGGISENRVDLWGNVSDFKTHLSQYHSIDIALDPFPYNGTTTTCEALWMGVPVLTITGSFHSERVGTVLLQCIGFTDWIARNEKQFLQKASFFAKQPQVLSQLRQQTRRIMRESDLCNGELHTQKLESAYRKIWISK